MNPTRSGYRTATLIWFLNGVADGTRTRDNRNHNPGLYQLSYSHRWTAARGKQRPRGKSVLACPTGIEPITPSLEGWCSIRLSYGQGRLSFPIFGTLVGARGFEPPTSCSQSRHATRLRHAPEARYYNRLPANGSILPPRNATKRYVRTSNGATSKRDRRKEMGSKVACDGCGFLLLKRLFCRGKNRP
jgi:hypothetical protein